MPITHEVEFERCLVGRGAWIQVWRRSKRKNFQVRPSCPTRNPKKTFRRGDTSTVPLCLWGVYIVIIPPNQISVLEAARFRESGCKKEHLLTPSPYRGWPVKQLLSAMHGPGRMLPWLHCGYTWSGSRAPERVPWMVSSIEQSLVAICNTKVMWSGFRAQYSYAGTMSKAHTVLEIVKTQSFWTGFLF